MFRALFRLKWLARTAAALLCIAVFLFMGWWQWSRSQSSHGTLQNFGYAIEWVVFAGFVGVMWWRMLRDDVAPAAPESRSVAGDAEDAAAGPRHTELVTSGIGSPAGFRPAPAHPGSSGTPSSGQGVQEPDEEVEAYNRYLAWLNGDDETATSPAPRPTRGNR
jgi:hypothetical protein